MAVLMRKSSSGQGCRAWRGPGSYLNYIKNINGLRQINGVPVPVETSQWCLHEIREKGSDYED